MADHNNYDYEKNPQGVNSLLDFKLDKRTKRFLEAISSFQMPKILEIGMGEGRFLKKIVTFRPDAKIFGLDISKTAVAAVKRDPFLKGNFTVGNAEKLPYQANFFDVVVIMDVLEHVNNPKRVVSEVTRVLKPGGIFHFYVPCENQPLTLDWFLRRLGIMKNFTKISFGHIQYFAHKDIKKIVSDFDNQSFTYSDHLLSQLIYFLILYLPKTFVLKLGRESQLSDRNFSNKKRGFQLKLAQIGWYAILVFPASIISELEALLLKHQAFVAKGLHFTGRKSIRKTK